jgi:hypothetical protein
VIALKLKLKLEGPKDAMGHGSTLLDGTDD